MKYLSLQLPRVLASHNSHLRVSWPKIAAFFFRLHSLFRTQLIQWTVDKWVQRSNTLALKRQISKVIWTPKLTIGVSWSFCIYFAKTGVGGEQTTFLSKPTSFAPFPRDSWEKYILRTPKESLGKIYIFSQESLNANFYLRVYFQDNLI